MRSSFFALLLLIVLGCSGAHQPQSTLHMQKSQDLKRIMLELDLVVYEQLKSELERDKVRKRVALNLASTLAKLSKELEVSPHANIKSEKKEKYLEYIQRLRSCSEDISLYASRYEFARVKKRLEHLERLCNDCHATIRGGM